MPVIIEVRNLTKEYPDGTRAVDGVSFDVKEGEFFGFLGPNGAGKSTTIRILTTLISKSSGTIVIDGKGLDRDPEEIRRIIGVQSQEVAVDGDLTGRQNLMLEGHLHRLKGAELERRVDELLSVIDLAHVADKRAARYSVGMKRRLDLVSALVSRPKLLFLDEPTVGLDPQSRGKVWRLLQRLNREEGTTIFFTTQYMEEADRLCDRVAIIDGGRIVAIGSPAELKQSVRGDTIRVELAEANNGENSDAARKVVTSIPGVLQVAVIDGGVVIRAESGGRLVPEVIRAFDSRAIPVGSVTVSSPSLDDVFLETAGRRIRPEVLSRPKRRMMFH